MLLRRFVAPSTSAALSCQQQQQQRPFYTIIKGMIQGRRHNRAAQYVSLSSIGNVDTATAYMGSRQADAEWRRVRWLGFFCGMSTIGSSAYFTYFPEKAHAYKDDPNSRFSR